MHKVGYIDCVQAKGLALYSHPDESLARERIFSQPVTGCKSKARLVRSVVVSCWSYSHTYVQICFWWFINIYLFLTFLDSSPAQSTSVQ